MKFTRLLVVLSMIAVSAQAGSEYKAKKKMGEGKFQGQITYLAAGNDMIYALEDNGELHAFSPDSGNRKKQYRTGLSNTQSLAVNAKGEIFVFSTSTKREEKTNKNRKYTVDTPIGVTCKVFDKNGKELRTLKIDALKSAKGAQFVGDTLVVADLGQRKLVFIDPANGEVKSEVKKGLRLCCGIFDCCVGPDNTVAVANLGAFKLQQYNMDGKKINEFGQRGKGFNDFQGCCNPVSAGYLADGRVVTVEKSPTRIKIYDAEGKNAQSIDGVEELVKGCSHIPVAIDADGNIFLAAGRKGYIVKCSPKS